MLDLPMYCRDHYDEHVRRRPSHAPRTVLPPPLSPEDKTRILAAEAKRERKRKKNLR